MQAVTLFKSYFGGAFDEDAIRNNFVLIYELLDGMFTEFFPIYFFVNKNVLNTKVISSRNLG